MKIEASAVSMNGTSQYSLLQKKDFTATTTTANIDMSSGKVIPVSTVSVSGRSREMYMQSSTSSSEGYIAPNDDKMNELQNMFASQNKPKTLNTDDMANKMRSALSGLSQPADLSDLIVDTMEEFKKSIISICLEAMKTAKDGFRGLNSIGNGRFKKTMREMQAQMSAFGRAFKQAPQFKGNGASQPQGNGFMQYTKTETAVSTEIKESQKMSFSASVDVRTASGESISISIETNMSREFYQKVEGIEINETLQRLIDPLVINFDATSAGLSDTKFSFDLDCDGKSDQISTLLKGSGFLALDKNNDGKINDGSELFGTKSGNGFQDLAAYDKDSNGWIDENDDIFDKLRVWVKDDTGEDKLIALGEAGVGAIYLGNVSTDYWLKSESNAVNGQISSTGIFLKEDYTGGTIQHVNFGVYV